MYKAKPRSLSNSAGSESRFSIGVVVFFGTLLSSLLTLIVVPVMYALLCRKTQSPEHITRQLESQMSEMKQPA
ncbi:efflux RND transporter permease subunit [Endozoicomonas arenosclerae]|uniref:efflux RND transporter permease subunit n=1 Tax=Endozoicomonas arenosclerae TaxID=1633495 RepID=UPI001294741E|nr:efflux RND transporter permease subunit [Endozoicomonas arenosclerae]